MTQLVPRTELLQWMRENQSYDAAQSPEYQEVLQKLRTGCVLNLTEWQLASEWYNARRNLENLQSTLSGQQGSGSHSKRDLSKDTDGQAFQGESSGLPGNSLACELRDMAGSILANDEQVAHYEANSSEKQKVGDGAPEASSADEARPQPGAILGSYRLATPSGFVVFVAVQGERAPQLKIGVGLGLAGDLDLYRALEHGAFVNLQNIVEICNASDLL